MSGKGFRLVSLTLSGAGVPDAVVTFTEGLNIVVGASDTGKTFIAQCIDYMFGAKDPPKDIPEAERYERVNLVIQPYGTEQPLTLERSLRGGRFRLLSDSEPERILGEKHQAGNKDTVSHLLLDLCGLSDKQVRTNNKGETRGLSFRDIARLILVDEKKVIREDSPIYSGQVIKRTVEQNVFRLLLTGTDDSSIVERSDPKIVRGRTQGKTEVIESLIEGIREQLSSVDDTHNPDAIRSQLERIEATYREASDALSAEQQSVSALESQRRAAWERVRRIDSRIAVVMELRNRFALLREQYSSDIRRLESIAETGSRLSEMAEERCPVCGAIAEHHDSEHRNEYSSPEVVATASIAEARKTRNLLLDLETTFSETASELDGLDRERDARQTELEAIKHELAESLQPRLQEALSLFREAQSRREPLVRALGLFDRLDELEAMLAAVKDMPKNEKAEGLKGAVGSDEAEKFCLEVEALLKEWKFPNVDRVTFSEKEQDIVISGRKRSSHGKGVRAITHSSFTLGLMRYCRSEAKPHAGMAIIDSPLVVYREPDPGEGGFAVDVKEAFYRSLAARTVGSQIIILENDPPPVDFEDSVNIVVFTGNENGRWGFIPLAQSDEQTDNVE